MFRHLFAKWFYFFRVENDPSRCLNVTQKLKAIFEWQIIHWIAHWHRIEAIELHRSSNAFDECCGSWIRLPKRVSFYIDLQQSFICSAPSDARRTFPSNLQSLTIVVVWKSPKELFEMTPICSWYQSNLNNEHAKSNLSEIGNINKSIKHHRYDCHHIGHSTFKVEFSSC